MKKIFTLFIFASFASIALHAQVVTQTHMAFETTKTATWCNPCGTWAWPMQESIVATNNAKAVCVELHYSSSDAIYSSESGTMLNDFPYVNSTPAWYLNGQNRTVYSGTGGIYPTSTENALHSAIDSTFSTLADVQSAYSFTLSGNSLTVNTNTKFFNSVTGTYYLSIYLIENNVIAYQDGIGSSASHQNVLRASMSTSVFGDQVATGTTTANTIVAHTFTTTLNTGWYPQNMWLAAVIWKSNGTSYDFVNAYTNRTAVGIDELAAQGIDASIFPNPMAGEGRLALNLDNSIDHCGITVMDMTGRGVATVFTGSLHQGHHEFLIPAENLANGLYTLNINANGIISSRKIMIAR